jgi:hypothetical protein
MTASRILTRVGVALVLGLLLALLLASVASAWTAANLTTVSKDGDLVYNYDFTGKTLASSTVDWPVTMVFIGNASVSKVKTAYRNRGWSNPFVNTMYGYANDGAGFSWYGDGGIKTWATKSAHMRLYAPGGRMYNKTWGYYVFATTHFDNQELAKPPSQWFGMSEDAATSATQTAINAWGSKAVTVNAEPFFNWQSGEEVGATGERHIWQCDGMVTIVRVP